MNTKPQESDYSSHVSYCRALEEYCWKLEHLHLSAERCASDLSKGCAKLEGERDALRAELGKLKKQEPVAIGCTCPVCGEWQRSTPSGMVCKNGHGGERGINHKLYLAAGALVKESLTTQTAQHTLPDGWVRMADGKIKPPDGFTATAYTAGHCSNHNRPGGCQLHNLQCGYPECDRKPV